jgi:Type II secretory pathway, prepilin signal peptidase PulO and related peptidases
METLDILYLIFSGLFGLVIGSFLNVVIYRLPNNMNIAFPASHCPSCGNQLKWYHNIPVLSYIFLGGKCAYCKKPISPRYMMVELLNCILWILCYLKFGQNIFALLSMLFCSLMICVIYIDLEHMIIPDSINIAIAVVGILAIIFGNGQLNAIWWERLIGGFGMFLLSFGILALFRVILKKDAIGGGDIKFLGAVGLFLGWKLVLFGFSLPQL